MPPRPTTTGVARCGRSGRRTPSSTTPSSAPWPTTASHRAMQARSRWPRAMAYAVLGAHQVLRRDPDDRAARRLLADARPSLSRVATSHGLAVARAAAHLRQRRAARGDDRARVDARAAGPACSGPRAAGLAARPADLRRSPLRRPGRRARPARHPRGIRPAAHRGRVPRRGVPDGVRRDLRRPLARRRWSCARAWFDGDNDSGLVMHDDVSGGGLRRPRGRVGQRQPGRRVDARLAVHRADVRARGRRRHRR